MTTLIPHHVAPSLPSVDLPSLWHAYTLTRDISLRNKLIVHYMPVVKAIARNLSHRTPADVELDDLVQAGYLGLKDAIHAFDPDRGIKFESYCTQRVRGSILDYLRSLDWAPRMLRRRIDRIREAALQIEMCTGRAPTDSQLCEALNVSPDELASMQIEVAAPPMHRIRFAIDTDNDSSSSADSTLDALPDTHTADPSSHALREDLREFLNRGLSDIERQIIILYYYDSLSFREIGLALNLCESRVSQLHQSLLTRLRDRKDRLIDSTLD